MRKEKVAFSNENGIRVDRPLTFQSKHRFIKPLNTAASHSLRLLRAKREERRRLSSRSRVVAGLNVRWLYAQATLYSNYFFIRLRIF